MNEADDDKKRQCCMLESRSIQTYSEMWGPATHTDIKLYMQPSHLLFFFKPVLHLQSNLHFPVVRLLFILHSRLITVAPIVLP